MSDLIKRDDALEPCPFCKCEKVTTWFDRDQGDKWGYASCDGCAARGPEVRTNWDREPDAPWHSEAIAAWNTRALPAVAVETCWKCDGSGMAIGDDGDPCVCNECKYDGVIPVDPAAIREAALQARIEELENSLAWYQMMDAMSSDHVVELTDKLEAAEAKLTKAKAYLQKISRHANRSCAAIAAHALAELDKP